MTPVRHSVGLLAVVMLSLVVVACSDSGHEDDAGPTSSSTSVASSSPATTLHSTTSSSSTSGPAQTASSATSTPTSSLGPSTSSPSAECVDGWITPEPGTELRTAPLDALRAWYNVSGPFVVDEMRYFEGPQDPAILLPEYAFMRHWYVKASRQSDPDFRARWLLVAPPDMLPGLDAVAPFDSTGLEPGDWVSFFGESDQFFEMPGLPGFYYGIPFDFVTGVVVDTGEPDGGPFGLPPENRGCLEGT